MPDFSRPPWGDWIATIQEFVVPIVLIVVFAVVAIRLASLFVRGIVKALLDRETREGTAQELSAIEVKKRMETLDDLGSKVIRFFIIVIAGLMILGTVGLDIGPAVAGLGVVGIAVGFGAQTLIRDWLAGIFIVLENQFSEGDVVRLSGVEGVVEAFSLRRTTLRDFDGTIHTVPNGQITVASNLTRLWTRLTADVRVPAGTDLERAAELVNRMGAELYADPEWTPRLLEPPIVVRHRSTADTSAVLRVLAQARVAEAASVADELPKRLVAALRRAGIEATVRVTGTPISAARGEPEAARASEQKADDAALTVS